MGVLLQVFSMRCKAQVGNDVFAFHPGAIIDRLKQTAVHGISGFLDDLGFTVGEPGQAPAVAVHAGSLLKTFEGKTGVDILIKMKG